jgi:hypothetical protein
MSCTGLARGIRNQALVFAHRAGNALAVGAFIAELAGAVANAEAARIMSCFMGWASITVSHHIV